MPKCKNCGKNLTIDDKELCPYCGQSHPFDLNNDNDQTQFIDDVIDENKAPIYKRRSFKVYIALFLTLGVFGIHQFYAKKLTQGFVILGINILFIVGLGFLLNYLFSYSNELTYLGFLISFGICFVLYLILGLIALIKHNTLDGEGQVIE